MTRAINTVTAFVRCLTAGKSLPELHWQYQEVDGLLTLTVVSRPACEGARLWVARSSTQDFHEAQWEEKPVVRGQDKVVGKVEPPREGYLAFYAELDFKADGLPYHLSTQLHVAGGEPSRTK